MLMEGEMPGIAPPTMPQVTPKAAANTAGVVMITCQARERPSIPDYFPARRAGQMPPGIGVLRAKTKNAQKKMPPKTPVRSIFLETDSHW